MRVATHAIILSNFARGFDKYSRVYDKAGTPFARFPDRFHLLRANEAEIGVRRAFDLGRRLGREGEPVLLLDALVAEESTHANEETGIGRWIEGTRIGIEGLRIVRSEGAEPEPISVEEAMAASLAALSDEFVPYSAMLPRTVSVLPVALACQARCSFCFSKSSASLDLAGALEDAELVRPWLLRGAELGAERFVITGGGEPMLLSWRRLLSLVELGSSILPRSLIITNGMRLSSESESKAAMMARELRSAGLRSVAVSRHHHSSERNAAIMGVDPKSELALAAARAGGLRSRLVCVIQKGGIESFDDALSYVEWAAGMGVEEICFKELYVSTTLESAYHDAAGNAWSRDRQAPLSPLLAGFEAVGFSVGTRLPWGAPVLEGVVGGSRVTVALYSEPSLYWERKHGLARSWNVMADGRCLVSLEAPESLLSADEDE